jgi:hypothetical protein
VGWWLYAQTSAKQLLHTLQLHSNSHIPPCSLQVITPFNVYFNTHLIFKKGEVWRLFTNFFFFGNLGEPELVPAVSSHSSSSVSVWPVRSSCLRTEPVTLQQPIDFKPCSNNINCQHRFPGSRVSQ